jgi:nitrate/nitrite transporter NarK
MHYVITAEHPQHAGGVSGLILSVGNAGGFLGPVAFGLLAEQFSYRVAWAALAAAAVVAIVCVTAGGRGFAARRARAGVALA